MNAEMRSLLHAVDVIGEVRARLTAQGGVRELQQLSGFSIDELDLLVRCELSEPWMEAA